MELKNSIKKNEGGDFKSPGEGTHVMGLISIKNVEITFKDEKKEGFQFTFKSLQDPDALVCHRVSATLNPKSSLFRTMKKMTKNSLKESTSAEDAFKMLKDLVDDWYEVTVVEKEGKDGRIWANVDDCDVRPARLEDCPKELPLEYFGKVKPAPVKEVPIEEDEIPF